MALPEVVTMDGGLGERRPLFLPTHHLSLPLSLSEQSGKQNRICEVQPAVGGALPGPPV